MKTISKKIIIIMATGLALLVILILWKSLFHPILVAISPNCSTYQNGKQIEQCSCVGFEQPLSEISTESGYQFTQCVGYVSSVKNLEQ